MRTMLLLGVTGGVILGAAATAAVFQWRGPDPELVRLRAEAETLKTELAQARQYQPSGLFAGALGGRGEEAPGGSTEALEISPSFVPPEQPSEEARTEDTDRQARMRQEREAHFRTRLDALALRLNLSPAQRAMWEQRARALMETHEGGRGMWSAFAELEREMAAQLSPAQQQTYAAYQEERRVAGIEMAANAEMFQIQRLLGLTDQQKDAAFQKLAEVHTRMQDPQAMEAYESNDERMRALIDMRKEAMQGILTPPQMDLYLSQLENNPSYLRRMMRGR